MIRVGGTGRLVQHEDGMAWIERRILFIGAVSIFVDSCIPRLLYVSFTEQQMYPVSLLKSFERCDIHVWCTPIQEEENEEGGYGFG